MEEKRGKTSFLLGFITGAAAIAAAGGYYLFGPNGRLHRRGTERVIADMRDEIVGRIEDAKDMTEDAYRTVVDEIADSYALGKRLTKAQAHRAANRFKTRWRDMKRAAQDAAIDAELEADELEDE